jgi:hypothetical protein
MSHPNHDFAEERGIFNLPPALTQTALAPREAPDARREDADRPGLLERFDRWMARARQRERERYLAESNDIFELEQRMKHFERVAYF